jgi:N-acetylmuramoyl-L-alanine amidase
MNRRIRYILPYIFLAFTLGSFAQDVATPPPTKAYPAKGEAFTTFLRRNNIITKEHTELFIQLNQNKLGANNMLLADTEYLIPSVKTEFYEPLFGPKYAQNTIESDKFKGACFYLVSGHGGPDPGAIGNYENHKLCEDEYAYDITLRLARNLMIHGAKVHIIIQDPDDGIRDDRFLNYDNHETCMGETIPLDQLQRLKQRSDKINELDKKETDSYRRSIHIHLDSRSVSKQIDVFFYHFPGSTKGQQLANTLRDIFDQKYKKHQPTRGFTGTISERNLYVLKATNPTAVFIELGNIQNWRDQQRFILENNRQAVANWLLEGLLADFEKEKKITK